MRHARLPLLALSAVLVACGGGGSGPVGSGTAGGTIDPPLDLRGTLAGSTQTLSVMIDGAPVAQLTPERFSAWLDAQQAGTTTITGRPSCTVTLARITYHTLGARGEAATAAAALMLPSGPGCEGPRPVLLYAHGTSIDRAADMGDLAANAEARLVAAMYAADGYVVVAPNYTGYAGSDLPYHPYLNAAAQADDLVDAWRAARRAFPALGVSVATSMVIGGYSQGGFVALAAQRALQERFPAEAPARAVAGMSGPYALLETGDAMFGGAPTLGATGFLPLLTGGAQHGGAALYATAAELYAAPYAAGIDDLLPGPRSAAELLAQGLLPPALFADDSAPQTPGHADGFGPAYLVRSAYRAGYLADVAAQPCTDGVTTGCAPANALRRYLRDNDLRRFVPAVPLLLCGGDADPTVPYANTQAFVRYLAVQAHGPLEEVNVDTTPNFGDSYRNAKLEFAAAKLALRRSGGDAAVRANYHAGLVAPFCMRVARDYFRSKL